MKTLKNLFMGLSIGAFAFAMFFIGLGIAVVMTIILAIAGLFMKSQSHAELKQQWQTKRQSLRKRSHQRQGTVIDGQYDIVENH